jgi:hypothetical protein
MEKLSEKWTWSDKLAIALACSGAAMALILFLVEKTPVTVGAMIACIAGLLVYPILHFVSSWKARVPVISVMVVLVCLFGWSVWPKTPPIASILPKPTPTVMIPSANQPRTDQSALAQQPHAGNTARRKHEKLESPYYSPRICPPGKVLTNGLCIDLFAPGIYGDGPGQITEPHTVSNPSVVVQPGGAASFGQQGGITVGQIIVNDESKIPIQLSYSHRADAYKRTSLAICKTG